MAINEILNCFGNGNTNMTQKKVKSTLRDYQKKCYERAKKENTIVHLPTGKGKTLIAVRLIDHFLRLSPQKNALFLVPTRILVEQQAK